MKQCPFVVIRSNDICFLGILRSCGIAGIPVVPVVFNWPGSGPWFSEASKYYINPIEIPNPATDEKGAVKSLIELGKKLNKQYGRKIMIVPSSDTNLMLLQNNFKALMPYFLQMGAYDFRSPRMDVVMKDSFADILESANILIPKNMPCLSKKDIDRVVDEIPYPCVYKPTHKDYIQSFQNSHNMLKAIECSDRDNLRARLAVEMDYGYTLVVQEKIEFEQLDHESSCHVYADSEYRIRLASTSNKEGEIPRKYGSGTLSRLTWIDELLPLSQAVVSALKWHGMLGIEFMKDKRDGKWKVIEANCRPWLHIYMQCYFGFNHFEMLHKDAYGRLNLYREPRTPTRKLVTSRPLHINLSAAIKKVSQEIDKGAYNPDPLTQWINNISGTLTFNYLNSDDPEPGNRELRFLIKKYDRELKKILSIIEMIYNAFT